MYKMQKKKVSKSCVNVFVEVSEYLCVLSPFYLWQSGKSHHILLQMNSGKQPK